MSEADQLLIELRQLRSMGLLTGENAAIAAEYSDAAVVETSAVATRAHNAAIDAEGARISALTKPEIQQAQTKVAAAKQDLKDAKRTLKNLEDYVRKHDHEWRVHKVGRAYDGTTTRGWYEPLDDQGREAASSADHKVNLAEQQVKAVDRRLQAAEEELKQVRERSRQVPFDPQFESECDALLDIAAACEAARAVIKQRQLLIAARKLDQRDGIGEHPEPS